MGFYIVFNNTSVRFEPSQAADLVEVIETAVTHSIETAGLTTSEVGQVAILVEADKKTLLKVEDTTNEAVSVFDYDKNAALLSQVLTISAPQTEETPLPKNETKVLNRNEDDEKFYPVFENLGISLRYRIDYADIFESRQEIENSESVSKLAKENMEKERAEQDQQAERRFQEKQTENLRESLKQKRFASQLKK